MRVGTLSLALMQALVLSVSCALAQSQTPAQNTKTPPPPKISPESEHPKKFGFVLVSVEQEKRDASLFAVEGLTQDNWRFVLSCSAGTPRHTLAEFKAAKTQDHVASEEFNGGGLTIYNLDDSAIKTGQNPWSKEFTTCLIVNRLANADDVFDVRVLSSEFVAGKRGGGYSVQARGPAESFRLACSESSGEDYPCVSVPPETYRAIRSGSDLRLCDSDLNVISRYRITSERP